MTSSTEAVTNALYDLTHEAFLRVFRHFLDEQAYPYPDVAIVRDRDAAVTVLLAHANIRDIARIASRFTLPK